MADKTIKIRAKVKGDTAVVKSLITHPMETGQRKDKKTGNLIPAHFIQEVKCEHNNKLVLTGYWSGGVSKNPYLSFNLKGAKVGDTLKLTWTDNQGGSDSAEATMS